MEICKVNKLLSNYGKISLYLDIKINSRTFKNLLVRFPHYANIITFTRFCSHATSIIKPTYYTFEPQPQIRLTFIHVLKCNAYKTLKIKQIPSLSFSCYWNTIQLSLKLVWCCGFRTPHQSRTAPAPKTMLQIQHHGCMGREIELIRTTALAWIREY
jgi:hypothetical protein